MNGGDERGGCNVTSPILLPRKYANGGGIQVLLTRRSVINSHPSYPPLSIIDLIASAPYRMHRNHSVSSHKFQFSILRKFNLS